MKTYRVITIVLLASVSIAVAGAKSEGRSAVLLRIQRRGQPAIFVPVRIR